MEKIDYNRIMQKEIMQYKTKKLLLHCCCAPCATSVIERLKDDFNLTLYFYNPNIMPINEYEKRLNELKRLAKIHDLPLIESEYDNEAFLSFALKNKHLPEGGQRCNDCIRMRLKKTASYAKTNGFDLFCSTLSVSPHKNASMINSLGEELSMSNCLWLHNDFKKQNGYVRSTEICRELGIYRQSYCGCKL